LGAVEAAAERAHDGLVPGLRRVPGFAAYYLVHAGNDTLASIALFQTEESAAAGERLLNDWFRHDWPVFQAVPPELTRGAVRPRYRDVHAVREVTFRIDPGEIVAFLGPNGAGKTTALKMLAGLLYPTSGRVEVAGFVPWGGGPEFKRRIALVLGNRQQLVWDLPPEETFLLNRAIYEIAPAAYRERLAEFVTLLELGDVLDK